LGPLSIINIFLIFLLVAIISGNNLPVCSGTIIATRIVSKNKGILLTILGYISGLILQGDFLKKAAFVIFPIRSEINLSLPILIALLIFSFSHVMRIPQSFSVNFASSLVGISLALNVIVNWDFILSMIAFWIFAPIASIILMILLMNLSSRFIKRDKIWSTLAKIKLILIIVSFFNAFILGANTLGFLYNVAYLGQITIMLFILAIVIGSFLFSSGEIRRISFEIVPLRYINSIVSLAISIFVLEIATLLSFPISNTQTFTASLYGAGLSYKTRIILKRPLITIAVVWIVGAFFSFLLGYLLIKAYFILYNF